MENDTATDLTLRISEFCPFCHSNRLVLTEKKLPYQTILIDLTRPSQFKHLLSPYRRVPVLVHNDYEIYESPIINEYLEDEFPDCSLLPEQPADRANIRFWTDFIQTRLVSAYFALMNEENPAHWQHLNDSLNKWLIFLEEHAFEDTYLCCGQLSLADYSLYPWIERFVSVSRYRNGSIPPRCKNLRRWRNLMKETDTVKQCAKSDQEYIQYFDQYWIPTAEV